jgi:hypothetical protein
MAAALPDGGWQHITLTKAKSCVFPFQVQKIRNELARIQVVDAQSKSAPIQQAASPFSNETQPSATIYQKPAPQNYTQMPAPPSATMQPKAWGFEKADGLIAGVPRLAIQDGLDMSKKKDQEEVRARMFVLQSGCTTLSQF